MLCLKSNLNPMLIKNLNTMQLEQELEQNKNMNNWLEVLIKMRTGKKKKYY